MQRCVEGVQDWQAAQVDYPAEVTVEAGDSVQYVAAVDVNDVPTPAETVIPGPSATSEPVFVRCEIAARLKPVGRGLTVDATDWMLRDFTPSGLIRWSWSVTGSAVGNRALELELEPAVRDDHGKPVVSDASTEISSFITRTRVTRPAAEGGLGEWWRSNWDLVTLIATCVGTAIIGLLSFGKKLIEALRSFRDTVRASRTSPTNAPRTAAGGRIRLARVGEGRDGTDKTFYVGRSLPPGVRRADLVLDGWLKDVAPSVALRRWFTEHPQAWPQFHRRYLAELEAAPLSALQPLLEALRADEVITLLYREEDPDHNCAVVLREHLVDHLARTSAES